MATWPSGTKASTTNLDAGTDSPASARADIKQNTDNVNSIIDMFNIATPSNNQILKYNTSNARFELASDVDTGITDVVQDTTPQLGGSLDVNGNSIVSASNGDISITPNGTGSIVLDGLNWPQADGTADYVLKTNGSGQLSWVAQPSAFDTASPGAIGGTTASAGTFTTLTVNAANDLRLADTDSSHYVGFKAPATVTTNKIWTLPSADGSANQVLSTNGSGTLSWATAGGANPLIILQMTTLKQNVLVSNQTWEIGISELYDSNNLVSVSGSVEITLPAGNYWFEMWGQFGGNDASDDFQRLIIRDQSTSTTIKEFESVYTYNATPYPQVHSKAHFFTLGASTAIRFQYKEFGSSNTPFDSDVIFKIEKLA